MKFKVGDKVKLVSMIKEPSYYEEYLGKIFTIKEISKYVNSEGYCARFKENSNINPWLKNLVLVSKKEKINLRESPIGSKISYNNETYIKCSGKYLSSGKNFICIDGINEDDIIKIEEPTEYREIYHKEILDEVEKEYLREVIKPFRNRKIEIYKGYGLNGEYIMILLKTEGITENIALPCFKEGTMYKGMKLHKEYSLEELGL